MAAALDPTRSLDGGDIIVVEDDDNQRSALRALLTHSGYRVRDAADGIEALQMAAERPPDLLLTDMHMPRMSGIQLTRKLRELPECKDVAVVLMSGVADNVDRVTGLDAGASDFVAKPIDLNELLARIRAQLRRVNRTRELLVRSNFDALTGVLNRRGILDELMRELRKTERSRKHLSVLLVDVDNFKAINDTRGHAAGDDVLVRLAKVMEGTFRVMDRVGRYGGDEFLAVLPECDRDAADNAQRRLQKAWRAASPTGPGISIGVTTARAPASVEEVFRRADEAMYRKKEQKAQLLLRHIKR